MRKNFKKMAIEQLRAELDWYTFEASEAEYDVQEVERLLVAIEVLEPVPFIENWNWKTGLKELKQDYLHVSERKQNKILSGMIAAAAIFLVFIIVNIGTYATVDMNVFEYVSYGVDKIRFFFTGVPSHVEFIQQEPVYYPDLYSVRELYPGILLPKNMPNDMTLDNIHSHTSSDGTTLNIKYMRYGYDKEMHLNLSIRSFMDVGWKSMNRIAAEYMDTEILNGIEVHFYHDGDDEIMAYFFHDISFYSIYANITLDEIREFIENLE